MSAPPPEAEIEAEVIASDLFFGLAGILIVILCLATQTLRAAVAERAEAQSQSADEALARAATQSGAAVAIAGADGVALIRPLLPAQNIPTDAIADAPLMQWAATSVRLPIVVVLPDAVDSAFLLESALTRAGISQVARVRLSQDCPDPRISTEGVLCDGG